jgi:hypothetical protein
MSIHDIVDVNRAENVMAYYPGETPLFGGEISVGEFETDEAIGSPIARASVLDDPSLDIALVRELQPPLRTQFAGYFLRQAGNVFVCNVDLELPEQPSSEIVAKALLAAMKPELPITLQSFLSSSEVKSVSGALGNVLS